ncbi:MAG: hypothetical protein JW963_25830 [Anaerolineales bacterium]|nr:hypothetical protein [Anaerolineales bacterium]
MDLILTINNSMLLLDRLMKISKNIREAEFKNILADLHNELADAKLAAATLKEQIIALKEENAVLKHQLSTKEKPDIKWGCYYFDGDDSRLYCTACYDSQGMKSLTTRINSKYRKCNVCGATIGT